ncbi:phosphotriesterase family protein [Cyclobacterium jeungdonense]|uniref:Phosphotriesterase n=1 Tax=Cyclobacterium jeungdonense TaxID=708087 RepID=A0ABT8C803_9BACT|nr:phosphotriesterase [Cyclobacterium jeungdonense]MDN3688487.1 phosphotriesterase [Cyclobacterium jeungdonense]
MKKPLLLLIIVTLSGWIPAGFGQNLEIMTVKGPIPANQMGRSLIHEHLLVDFIGADKITSSRWDQAAVLQKVEPYVAALPELKIRTLVSCTPAYLGRDPELLRKISEQTGIQILTNTGYYGAVDNAYLPAHAFSSSAETLAGIWTDEWKNGIGQTGIKPGFIKIGVNSDSLSELHQKLILAAGLTHKQTGLTIASHTGPFLPAKQQVALLKANGVHPSAFIWVHAQNERNKENYSLLAAEGAWISLDGVQPSNLQDYLEKLSYLKEQGWLEQVLISHDAGWYRPGEEDGGDFRDFSAISTQFIPLLLKNGFTEAEIDQLLVKNPANAFAIQKRTYTGN